MADLEPWSWSRLNKIIKIYRLRGLEGWVGEVRGEGGGTLPSL